MAENHLTIRINYVDMQNYHHVDYFDMTPEFYAEHADILNNMTPVDTISVLYLLNVNARRVNGPQGFGSAVIAWEHEDHAEKYLSDPLTYPHCHPLYMSATYYTEEGAVDKTVCIQNRSEFEETGNGITMDNIEESILNEHRRVLEEKPGRVSAARREQNILCP